MNVIDLNEKRKAQKSRDEAFSEFMVLRYAEYDVVTKAVRTLRRRGHDPIDVAKTLRYVADELMQRRQG
jgi:hypothetical protein